MIVHLNLLETKLFFVKLLNQIEGVPSILNSFLNSLKIDQQKEVTKPNSITTILHENGDEEWDPSTI